MNISQMHLSVFGMANWNVLTNLILGWLNGIQLIRVWWYLATVISVVGRKILFDDDDLRGTLTRDKIFSLYCNFEVHQVTILACLGDLWFNIRHLLKDDLINNFELLSTMPLKLLHLRKTCKGFSEHLVSKSALIHHYWILVIVPGFPSANFSVLFGRMDGCFWI